MKPLRLAVFADGQVGYQTIEFLRQSHPDHLVTVFLVKNSAIHKEIVNLGIQEDIIHFHDSLYTPATISHLKELDLDYIVLAWWPYIIKPPVFSIPAKGILNYHPSFLPYNRGKHYNFWTLVEDTPFGVTIHFIDENIDSGDIVFQKRIQKSWEDTGQLLYQKAQTGMIELFMESYPKLISSNFKRIPQDATIGSFHYAKELDPASEIVLNNLYSGKDLLNLIRARVFPPHPSCWVRHNNKRYNVSIDIKQSSHNKPSENAIELMLDTYYLAKDVLPNCTDTQTTKKFLYFSDNKQYFNAVITVSPEK